jgi:hypothetical protein
LLHGFSFVFDVFSDEYFEVGDEVLGKRPCTERQEGTRTSGKIVQPRRTADDPVIKKSTGKKKRPLKPDDL